MIKICENCGKEYRIKDSHASVSRYCSTACVSIAYKSRMKGSNNPNYRNAGIKTCIGCGKKFQSYDKDRKYCSWECYSVLKKEAAIARKPKLKAKQLILRDKHSRPFRDIRCIKCGKIFFGSRHRRLCDDCAPGKLILRTCPGCGKIYSCLKSRAGKYCSPECLSLYRSLNQKGEKAHHWQGGKTDLRRIIRNSSKYSEWRYVVFGRDDFTCQMCGKKGDKIVAHHIKPFSKYPELRFEVTNGITLCRPCHHSIQWKESEWEDYFVQLVNPAYRIFTSVEQAVRSVRDEN